MSPTRSDSLIVELEVPDEAPSGATLQFTIRLRNTSNRPLSLHLRGRDIAFDLVVSDSDGEVVWERLEGENVMAIVRIETLAPEQTLELRDVWELRAADGSAVPEGMYRLQGFVPTDQRESLRTPVEFVRVVSPT